MLDNMVNTIQFGDCYELIKKIPNSSVDCVYVDIPYLYFQGGEGNSELGHRAMKKRKELINDNLENGCDLSIFNELIRILKKINIFVWCSKSQVRDIMNVFNKYGPNFELLVWCKTNPQPTTNNTWLPDIEYCLYFREKGIKLNDGYDLKSKWYISSVNKSDKDLYKHPTIKPLELVKRHILHATQPNDIVLDCFCGSGTTCVAAKETGRRFIGMEINPKYYKIAVDRLNGINANGQTSIFTDFEKMG